MAGFYVLYEGKEPVCVEPNADDGTALVTFEDGTTQIVPLEDIEMDNTVRRWE